VPHTTAETPRWRGSAGVSAWGNDRGRRRRLGQVHNPTASRLRPPRWPPRCLVLCTCVYPRSASSATCYFTTRGTHAPKLGHSPGGLMVPEEAGAQEAIPLPVRCSCACPSCDRSLGKSWSCPYILLFASKCYILVVFCIVKNRPLGGALGGDSRPRFSDLAVIARGRAEPRPYTADHAPLNGPSRAGLAPTLVADGTPRPAPTPGIVAATPCISFRLPIASLSLRNSEFGAAVHMRRRLDLARRGSVCLVRLRTLAPLGWRSDRGRPAVHPGCRLLGGGVTAGGFLQLQGARETATEPGPSSSQKIVLWVVHSCRPAWAWRSSLGR